MELLTSPSERGCRLWCRMHTCVHRFSVVSSFWPQRLVLYLHTLPVVFVRSNNFSAYVDTCGANVVHKAYCIGIIFSRQALAQSVLRCEFVNSLIVLRLMLVISCNARLLTFRKLSHPGNSLLFTISLRSQARSNDHITRSDTRNLGVRTGSLGALQVPLVMVNTLPRRFHICVHFNIFVICKNCQSFTDRFFKRSSEYL